MISLVLIASYLIICLRLINISNVCDRRSIVFLIFKRDALWLRHLYAGEFDVLVDAVYTVRSSRAETFRRDYEGNSRFSV